MTIEESFNKIKEDFELLKEPNAIVEYILELGKENEMKLPPDLKNETTYIHGCPSDAWMVVECKDGKVYFTAEGSSALAKGMIPLILQLFNGRTPEEILAFDPKRLYELGFERILTPTRMQGLEAFLNKIYELARLCKE